MKRQIMGVLNVTPDSFSDGGVFTSVDRAVAHVELLIESGADWIDVGAESTRPGSQPVSIGTERQRLEPVLKNLVNKNLNRFLSVDTRHDEIALWAAEDMGVGMMNNVAGLYAPSTMARLSRCVCQYVAMHMHGQPTTMQENPLHGIQGFEQTVAELETMIHALQQYGFSSNRYLIDPGIGFGKDDAANLHILARVGELAGRARVLIGLSRKGFLGRLFQLEQPRDRDSVGKGFEFSAWVQGATIVRTHEVATLSRLRALAWGDA